MKIIQHTSEIHYFSQGEAGDVKTIVEAQGVTMTKGFMDPGQGLQNHRHPNEQMGYVLDGEAQLEVNGEKFTVRAGDTYYIPCNSWHAWKNNGLERFVYLDIFSPRREDLEKRFFDYERWTAES